MKSDYVCLNSKTFEIDDRKDIIPVDERLSKAISTLNKKGYYTEICYRAKISKPFYRSVMLQELIEEKLLDINDDTKDCTVLTIAHRIKTVINYDRILVLKDGEIEEFDTPENLINKKGLFYKMYKESLA